MDLKDIGFVLWICFIAAVIGLSLGRGVLVDESIAVKALENQGFGEIKITEKHWFLVGFRGCDFGDAAQFVARAKNPVGKEVDDIFVCSGWPFKGATIRSK